MNVLVTGGAGYVGSTTVAALRQRGTSVVVVDDLRAGHRAALDPEVPFHETNVGDSVQMERILCEHGIEAVVHFAAHIVVPESVRDPQKYYFNNVVNTLGLLRAMHRAGCVRIVFSSTAAVYGVPQSRQIAEDHPTRPDNPYGHSKLFVEQILRSYDEAYGMRHAALRYFNAAGGSARRGEAHDPETHLIPLVLGVALGQRREVHLYGSDYETPDGTCVRDYIHVEDLAQAHVLALDYLAGGGASQTLNLGNARGHSVREVLEVAREVTGRPIAAREVDRRPGDCPVLVADSSRARQVLGWTPRYESLREIVESAWGWHRTHPHGYEGFR